MAIDNKMISCGALLFSEVARIVDIITISRENNRTIGKGF